LSPEEMSLLAQEDSGLWKLHGEYYDFSNFAHPGGTTLLMLGKGRDSTELWESVHQFAQNPQVFKLLFDKYRVTVKGEATNDVKKPDSDFDWTPDRAPFFHELRRRAREYFQVNHLSTKADLYFGVFFTVYLITMISCIGYMLTHRSFLVTTIAAFMISFCGFSIMHSASHFALSSSPLINWIAFSSYCNFFGWFHHLWLQHHVWAHHSYTGILHMDPDITNIPQKFCRKNEGIAYRPHHKQNLRTELILLWIFPNQFVGQAMQYFCTLWRGKVFGMEVTQYLTLLDVLTTVVEFSSFLFLFLVLPVLSTGPGHLAYVAWCYFIMGMMYWACVVPNHEVIQVEKQETQVSRDWSIEQIRNSANFKIPYWLSFLIGGMNYQIEHHLFPTVHPRHFPALSKIVQEMCQKYNVPYVCQPSWFSAISSHFQFMQYFATKSSK
jgi:linoleoyl-CoA desaturase